MTANYKKQKLKALRKELAETLKSCKRMEEVNDLLYRLVDDLTALGLEASEIERLITPRPLGSIGYPLNRITDAYADIEGLRIEIEKIERTESKKIEGMESKKTMPQIKVEGSLREKRLDTLNTCIFHLDFMLQNYCPEEETNSRVTDAFYSLGVIRHILDKLKSSLVLEKRVNAATVGLLDLLGIILPNIKDAEAGVDFCKWINDIVRFLYHWKEEAFLDYTKEEKMIAEKNDEEAVNYLKRKK